VIGSSSRVRHCSLFGQIRHDGSRHVALDGGEREREAERENLIR
jgi:hypothetical protein